MYDKSKKTWSQRLKITKTEKSHTSNPNTTNATTATAAATTTTKTTTITSHQRQKNIATTLHYHQRQQQQQHQRSWDKTNSSITSGSLQNLSMPATPTSAVTIAVPPSITKFQQQFSNYHRSSLGVESGVSDGDVNSYEFSPSALTRSIKYTEPWIYGTVRGLPSGGQSYYYHAAASGVHYGYPMPSGPTAVFAHPPHIATSELAVLICSCSEYLCGTKREVKKASVCKKCKGSRLPLAPIGGTVRLHPSSNPLLLKAYRSSAVDTMRIAMSNKMPSRPTILDPQKDPYDLMRRSRLLSPEPRPATKLPTSPASSTSKSTEMLLATRNHSKNSSPARGRSRTRTNLPLPIAKAKKALVSKDIKSHSSVSVSSDSSFSEHWLIEEPEAFCADLDTNARSTPSSTQSIRRSILRCSVNPYDLISDDSSTSTPSSSSKPSTPTSTKSPLAIVTPMHSSPKTSTSKSKSAAPAADDFDVSDAKLNDDEIISFANVPKSGSINHESMPSDIGDDSDNASLRTTRKGTTKTSCNRQEETKQIAVTNGHKEEDAGVVSSSSGCKKKTYPNVKAIAGQLISLGETSKVTKKSLIKQGEDGRIYESIIIAGEEEEEEKEDGDNIYGTISEARSTKAATLTQTQKQQQQQQSLKVVDLEKLSEPKRQPPTLEGNVSIPEAAITPNESLVKQQINIVDANSDNVAPIIKLLSAPSSPAIKSILKRPICSNESAKSETLSTPTTTATKTVVSAMPTAATKTETQNVSQSANSRSPKCRHSRTDAKKDAVRGDSSIRPSVLAPIKVPESSPVETTTTTATRSSAAITRTMAAATPTATFYIPLPQARKKVQFMVEDKIIQVDQLCESGNENDNNHDTDDDNNNNHNDDDNNISKSKNNSNSSSNNNNAESTNAIANEDEVSLNEEHSTEAVLPPSSIAATSKSLNYEYYERKRKQCKEHGQQHQQKQQQQQKQQHKHKQQQHQQQKQKQERRNEATAHVNPCGQPTSMMHDEIATSKRTATYLLEPLNGIGVDDMLTIKAKEAEKTTRTQTTAAAAKATSIVMTADITSSSTAEATNSHCHHWQKQQQQHDKINASMGSVRDEFNLSPIVSNAQTARQENNKNIANKYNNCNVSGNNNLHNSSAVTTASIKSNNCGNSRDKSTMAASLSNDAATAVSTATATNEVMTTDENEGRTPSSIRAKKQNSENPLVNSVANAAASEQYHHSTPSELQPSQTLEPQLAESFVVVVAEKEEEEDEKEEEYEEVQVKEKERLLSHNPIRRTHSDRHSSLSDCLSTIATNKKNRTRKRNVVLDFKDTTALRERNFHLDSRNLFHHNNNNNNNNNNVSLRPKEPPPPPPSPLSTAPPLPPPPPTTTTTSTIISSALAATNQKASASDTQKTLPTSTEGSRHPLTPPTLDSVNTTLSPTHHAQQQKQQQSEQNSQEEEEEDQKENNDDDEKEEEKLTINTGVDRKKHGMVQGNSDCSRKRLENHNDGNQQLQPQLHQYHSLTKATSPTTTKRREYVVLDSGVSANIITDDSTASTKPVKCENQRNNKNNRANNKTNNNGISCQAISKGTTGSDNNQVDETATAIASTNNREYQRSSSHSNSQAGENASKTSTSTTATTTTYNKSADNNNFISFIRKPNSTNQQQNQQQRQQQQRTVVRVAPFIKNNSEVHRLKISHSDGNFVGGIADSAFGRTSYNNNNNNNNNSNIKNNCNNHCNNCKGRRNSHYYESDYLWQNSGPSSPTFNSSDMDPTTLSVQKKTSILINGDDCYSTMNISHDAAVPLYQSSVVVTDYASAPSPTHFKGLRFSPSTNTVTINVTNNDSSNIDSSGSPGRSAEEELIYQHNQLNNFLSKQAMGGNIQGRVGASIIPINSSYDAAAANAELHRSASSISSTSATSSNSGSSSNSNNNNNKKKQGTTLIKLGCNDAPSQQAAKGHDEYSNESDQTQITKTTGTTAAVVKTPAELPVASTNVTQNDEELFSHEAELVKILRNPVEAVRRNIVPHVCGKNGETLGDTERSKKMSQKVTPIVEQLAKTTPPRETPSTDFLFSPKTPDRNSFISKLLEDPVLSNVAEGLENETIVQLIENSLNRLKLSCSSAIDASRNNDNNDIMRLINSSLMKLREERELSTSSNVLLPTQSKDEDDRSNRGSISSATSFSSANNYEMFEFDTKSESDCYHSCSSEITSPGDEEGGGGGVGNGGLGKEAATTRSKFYQMLVDATLAEIEISTSLEDEEAEHHYESIRNGNGDPIYEEIGEVPPPLPLTAPPINDAELEKKTSRSMFEGASKYDILSYLVDAKERGLIREEVAFDHPLNCSNPIIIEEEASDTLSDLGKRKLKIEGRDNSLSRASVLSDSSEDNQSTMSSLSPPPIHSFLAGNSGLLYHKENAADIERNDSGVGSETSKSSRSKYQNPLATNTTTSTNLLLQKHSPIHLCEDCDGPVETQITDNGVVLAPLVCRKCGKKRAERKEIITEIVETEEKYGRDLQIILEEFCQPMLVAGLLTQEQLSAIFLNTEELLENNQTLAERMRDALDIALEQGDDDLLTVNIGRIFLDSTQMLHAFESYCVRQAGASLLLANLEKEKELLRIFLKVSQMENTVLRRMNLNSFLMVPVQRVTKYPLLLARLYKVTPAHLEGRDQLKQAQEKIELHLNHINQEAKDVPTKLWRRISSSSPNRRVSCEIDMINIKLRKMAIDVLEWNHDEVRFVMEGKLLYTQPTDSNWKKARTIKLTPVNALLVTNGKPSANYKAEKAMSDKLNFPRHNGVREASLLVVKEKCGRYALTREPLYLDRCVVCSEADWDDYFEVQEISSKDTFIFKAEDGVRTKQWYTQLQYHAQGMGAWRKRRNALANIMINGMLARS